MPNPIASILIPCYNGAQFVGEAIESGLSQTHPDVEVVVVDDGSTDDSLRVIRSFGDRIRYESIPNGGACRARNHGATAARGEFLQFLDADDLLYPEKIAEQLRLMANGNVDCVFCNAEAVPLDRSGPARLRRHARHADPVVAALGANAGTPSGLHRRDSFFSIGGFREDLVAAQDRDFHLRLACSGKSFAWIDRVLVTERRHDGSISSDHLHVLRQYESIAIPLFEKLRETGGLSDARARAFAAFMARAARMALRLHDGPLGERYFEIARSMHRSGGLHAAYGRLGRWMHRAVGPQYTALSSQWFWRLRNRLQ